PAQHGQPQLHRKRIDQVLLRDRADPHQQAAQPAAHLAPQVERAVEVGRAGDFARKQQLTKGLMRGGEGWCHGSAQSRSAKPRRSNWKQYMPSNSTTVALAAYIDQSCSGGHCPCSSASRTAVTGQVMGLYATSASTADGTMSRGKNTGAV